MRRCSEEADAAGCSTTRLLEKVMDVFVPIQIVFWLASLTLLAVSAVTDLKKRRIPNELVVAVAAIGVTLGLLTRPGALWLSLLAAASAFVALGVLSHYRIIGGGDLKLISAVTLLVPPDRIGQPPDRHCAGRRRPGLRLSCSPLRAQGTVRDPRRREESRPLRYLGRPGFQGGAQPHCRARPPTLRRGHPLRRLRLRYW